MRISTLRGTWVVMSSEHRRISASQMIVSMLSHVPFHNISEMKAVSAYTSST